MATILNDRDVLLQATSPRYTTPGDRALLISATTPVFHVTEAGAATPGVITITATLLNITGTVTFSASLGSTLTGATATTVNLDYANMPGETEVVQAQITYDSVLYQKSITIAKVRDGVTGADGSSGPVQIHVAGYSAWSDTAANDAIMAFTGRAPINRDIVTLYDDATPFSQTRFYDAGSWLVMDAYIPGNLLVSGTVSADIISGGTLRGVIIEFGTGHTVGGYAFQITSSGVVWVDNIFGGTANLNNFYYPTAPGCRAYTENNSAQPAVEGAVTVFNTNASACGVRGVNFYTGTDGLVGTASYDFYAIGSGTNYGPFTGAHDVLMDPDHLAEPGDIVVDYQCVARRGWSNTIFEVRASSAPNQAAVGVMVKVVGPLASHQPAAFIQSREAVVKPPLVQPEMVTTMSDEYYACRDNYTLLTANALGEGQVSVCGEGGNLAAGDLIVTSSTPGKGMRQADDVVRNYTVARAREAVTFEFPEQVKTVACIYLCG